MFKRRANINYKLCQNCSRCYAMENCPTGALARYDSDEPPLVDSTCLGCGTCIHSCPNKAIHLI